MNSPLHNALAFLPAGFAAGQGDRPFVVIVRTREELGRWLDNPSPGLQWIQVEGLLEDSGTWAAAAQSATDTPLDVVLAAPGEEFASLYRLVDVRASREVRVTMPAVPGFMKALRMAASLGLPARILPGQPSQEMLPELAEALDFYLHGQTVDAPIEPFHSLLAGAHGVNTGSLWTILEEDPAMYVRYGDAGLPLLPRLSNPVANEAALARYVERHIADLLEQDQECAVCPWRQICAGYFKWSDRTYSCAGVKQIFACVSEAASDLGRDLTVYELSG